MSSDEKIPGRRAPSRLPLGYFAFAHLCLAAAGFFLVVSPWTFLGFSYHPRMMVLVHLVTLGWISASILGAVYAIAPMALRCRLRETRLDTIAAVAFMAGVGGMISHFWLYSYGGMLWSALLVFFAVAVVGQRIVAGLWKAPVALGVKLHFFFGFMNFLVAAAFGASLGLRKLGVALPGDQISGVFAHGHLGALGWATMIVMGAGYRLLPMLLPSAVPRGWGPVTTAVLLQAGVLGLFGSWAAGSAWRRLFAFLVVAAVFLFLGQLVWMLRHRRPPARGLPRPDWGLWHLRLAFLYLGITVLFGIGLASFKVGEEMLWKLIPVYGTLGLVGFLAQMVVGVAARLAPLYFWFQAFADSEEGCQPPSPHLLGDARLQVLAFLAWALAVPCLAGGFWLQGPGLLSATGALLISAVLLSIVNARKSVLAATSGGIQGMPGVEAVSGGKAPKSLIGP